MSNDVSVDWGRVQSIANSAAQSAARSVHNKLAPRISQVESELNRLRREMSEIANAIARMSSEVQSELKSIHHLNERQLELGTHQLDAQRSTARTTGEILTTNVAGFTSTVLASNRSTDATNRGTDALVEVEYLRLYNEARAPMRFIEDFGAEIDERFTKGVEGVHINRELYDQHFRRIHQESDNKVRTIGEHIFRILEEDFEPTVQHRLNVPKSSYQALALEVDARRVDERSRQLDADLRDMFEDCMTPLLEMHHRFETVLAAEHAIDATGNQGELLIPAVIEIAADGSCAARVGCRLERAPQGESGLRFTLVEDGRYAPVRDALRRACDSLPDRLRTRPMSDDEKEDLMAALEKLADEGRIDASLLPGYQEYLDHYGLDLVESGYEVTLDLAEGAASAEQAGVS